MTTLTAIAIATVAFWLFTLATTKPRITGLETIAAVAILIAWTAIAVT